ncbi:MAG: VWA domain-containing protein [Vicinamibacterales bacterium]
MPLAFVRVAIVGALVTAVTSSIGAQSQEGFRFKSGVELINVTATVTDDDGRFVAGLRREDFTVDEDNNRQEITHFSNERVPVSLGILLDTSGSMTPDKMSAARAAIDRFIFDLLGPDDELFFVEFAASSRLAQGWTTDRRAISRAVAAVNANGGTALYDAVAEALPVTRDGKNQKKALLVISDGNDTNSSTSVRDLRDQIRESEVMVYALGVDGTATTSRARPRTQPPSFPIPFPVPGRRPPRIPTPGFPQILGGGGWPSPPGARVNADVLRQITDDTGGRTEIVRGFGDLSRATAQIADELSQQYYMGYVTTGKQDGRWHAIRVDVRDRRLNVRARRGYVAGRAEP